MPDNANQLTDSAKKTKTRSNKTFPTSELGWAMNIQMHCVREVIDKTI